MRRLEIAETPFFIVQGAVSISRTSSKRRNTHRGRQRDDLAVTTLPMFWERLLNQYRSMRADRYFVRSVLVHCESIFPWMS
jgi:hypothetical protein